MLCAVCGAGRYCWLHDTPAVDDGVRCSVTGGNDMLTPVTELTPTTAPRPVTTLPHVLVVTGSFLDGVDGRQYQLRCPETNLCRRWEACQVVGCTVNAEYQTTVMTEFAHGQPHQAIDGVWMVPTDDCLYAVHDQLPDAAAHLDLPAGEYPVDCDYLGDGDIWIERMP